MTENGGRLCVSGAARGADALWGERATRSGHAVVHWSFEGHRRHVPERDVVILSDERLESAEPFLESAAAALGRPWPPATMHAQQLLRRNYFQILWSDAIYTIADRDARGGIKGGTAWAVQMFIARFEGRPCRAFLFDQTAGLWNSWEGDGWAPIVRPPLPAGIWAGIGTRNLSPAGAAAVGQLLVSA
jgi:hypothetical protein